MNQWQPHAHQHRAASATACPSGNLSNAPAPSDPHSGSGLCFDLGFLDLVPDYDYDFGGLDTEAIFRGLDDTGAGEWNLNIDDDTGLFDVTLDMAVVGAQPVLGIGDEFLSQEPLLNMDPSFEQQQQQQPQTAAKLALPPTTRTTSKSPSIPGTSTFSLHPSPASSSSPSSSTSLKRKQQQQSSEDDESSAIALKRQRNTLAARKYRQKRLDRISELETALESMTGERDDLRLQLARREAEVDALREMLGRK
ncbi:hypothetical protein ACJ41O_014869 [Fusarium nematophilum]